MGALLNQRRSKLLFSKGICAWLGSFNSLIYILFKEVYLCMFSYLHRMGTEFYVILHHGGGWFNQDKY